MDLSNIIDYIYTYIVHYQQKRIIHIMGKFTRDIEKILSSIGRVNTSEEANNAKKSMDYDSKS